MSCCAVPEATEAVVPEDRRKSGAECSTSQPEARDEALRAISEVLELSGARLYREPGCISNAVEKPRSSPASQQCEAVLQEAEAAVGGRARRRGRPSGRGSWNKGMQMPAATRLKISSAQKARWRSQGPESRSDQSQKLKGRVPWNKGRPASKETRQKMSAAKRFVVYPRKTTLKMSQAHMGLTHSPETCALISKRLSGRVKSPEHKAAIAAGQRRRAAALRLMKTMRGFAPEESSIREEAFPETTGEPLPGSGNDLYTGGAVPHTRTRKKAAGRPPPNEAVVEEFVGQLRQFRALQQELAPWTEAFRDRTGRKPRVEDVEQTGIAWLVEKFKDYMRMRDRLLSESQTLRTKLEGGIACETGISSYREKMNANTSAGAASEGAMRMAKALQYKRARSTIETGAVPASSTEIVLENMEEAVKRIESPRASNGGNGASTSVAGTFSPSEQPSDISQANTTDTMQNGAAPGPRPKQTPSVEEIRNPSNLAGASPRVRTAMLAALQYKKKREKQATTIESP